MLDYIPIVTLQLSIIDYSGRLLSAIKYITSLISTQVNQFNFIPKIRHIAVLNLLIFLLFGSLVAEISKIEVDIIGKTEDRFYGEV
jgi:hypothetical protein